MTTPTEQPAERRTFPLPLGDREVHLLTPTEGQMLVLTRLDKMIDRGEVFTALMTFGDLLDNLIVTAEDRAYAYDGLVNETIQTEQYLNLLTGLLEKMKAEGNREDRRAAARKRAAPRARR